MYVKHAYLRLFLSLFILNNNKSLILTVFYACIFVEFGMSGPHNTLYTTFWLEYHVDYTPHVSRVTSYI
ncbi:hypothetical protein H8356DRAFT_1343571 [Neocallimastix lanati (nom. inval.)]|nr:hypothetical protein H8356DRAFT_1343571 [Neocallimastix sp. JGI-2020a]